MALILNKAQAEAIRAAMCAVLGHGVRIEKLLTWNEAGDRIEIEPIGFEGVRVWNSIHGRTERYADQNAFATAYELE